MNFIVLNHDNFEFFENVILDSFLTGGNRIALGAYEEDGTVLGAVSYALTGYEYYIDWLYVDPDYRRQKVATALLDEIFKSIESTMEIYPVSARFEKDDEYSGLYEFFESYPGFDVEYSHPKYHISAKDINSSTTLKLKVNKKLQTVNFFDEPVSKQKYIMSLVEKSGVYQVEDFDAWSSSCEKSLCRATLSGNNLLDIIIIQHKKDGNLHLAFLYSKYPEGLLELLTGVAKDIATDYTDAELDFEAVTDESVLLAKRLFPEAVETPVYEATW